jgi:hypothetical protein
VFGKAKISARLEPHHLYRRFRAGFEPRRVPRHLAGSMVLQSDNALAPANALRTAQIPRVDIDIKMAHHGRSEIFALPLPFNFPLAPREPSALTSFLQGSLWLRFAGLP